MIRLVKYTVFIVFILAVNPLLSQVKHNPLFTFGVIADVQYANQDNAGTRYYRSSPKKFAEAIQVFNQEKPDFVLSLGDFIDKNFSSYDTLNVIAKGLKMPLHHVLGNHEFSVNDDEKNKVLQKENLKKPYSSFVKNKWRFILLNGNDISLHAYPKGSTKYEKANVLLLKLKAEGLPSAQPWNGAIGKEQLQWLKKELATAQKNKEKVIMANHFPIFPDGEAELLWNAKEVRTLVEKYPSVYAYLNGFFKFSF
jgi:predicted MPP superfamily phosphohydrolase